MKLKICEWLIRHGMRRLAYSLSPSLFWIIETRRGLNEAMKCLAEENIIDIDDMREGDQDERGER